MTLERKRIVVAALSAAFLISLLFVQWMEVARKRREAAWPVRTSPCRRPAGLRRLPHAVDARPRRAVEGSDARQQGRGLLRVPPADRATSTASITTDSASPTIATPRDCSRCHTRVGEEFARSHHAAAGNILASLDNLLAETIEGIACPSIRTRRRRARAWRASTAWRAPTPAASSATAARSRS
jgi:hypothetical protein